MQPIPIAPCPSRQEFYSRWASKSQPVLFRGAAASWPAMSRWTFEWFEQEYAQQQIVIHDGNYVRGEIPGTSVRAGHERTMTMAQFISGLKQTGTREIGYLGGGELFQRAPGLLKDLRFPEFGSPALERYAQYSFWMGAPGTVTQVHHDRAHNLYVQIRGRKRWQLYSPTRNAELRPVLIHWAASSSELELGPIQDGAGGPGIPADYEFEVEPGDLLFLPYGWWHRVVTLEPSIAANWWWWTVPMVLSHGPEVVKLVARYRAQRALWNLAQALR